MWEHLHNPVLFIYYGKISILFKSTSPRGITCELSSSLKSTEATPQLIVVFDVYSEFIDIERKNVRVAPKSDPAVLRVLRKKPSQSEKDQIYMSICLCATVTLYFNIFP